MPEKRKANTDMNLTAAVEEGPYYKPGSPERKNIAEPGTYGTRLVLEGRVLNRKGQPVPGAWLDFWHADGHGNYDNEGYDLRGHQYADKDGRYRLETLRPGDYMMRSPHVHVKVRADKNSPVLTTQLFLLGEPKNETDPIFEKLTVMDVKDTQEGHIAAFDFVVEQ
jgi:protocatechuate 3,4-dioxygenase beta subunit